MKKPTLGFSNQNLAELRKFAEQIFDKMTAATATFAAPTPTLETLRETIQIFSESISEAAFNDRRAIVYRNKKRDELRNIIYELSKYVDSIAKGDEEIILLAGFIPSQNSTPDTSITPKASNLTAEPLGLGTSKVALKVTPWTKVKFYQFEYRRKGETGSWISALSSKSSHIFADLDAFEAYEFRATYLGKDATPNYSDIITTYAL